MSPRNLSLALFCAIAVFVCTPLAVRAQATGQLFTVNSTADSADAEPGDGACLDAAGKCTLRAAIQEANFNPSTRDAIIFALPLPAAIDLTMGELVITGGVYVVGPGARRLTVQRTFADGTPNFRLFRITMGAGSIGIRGLKLRNGNAGTGSGGAIAVEGPNSVTLTELWMTDNKADNGGAISNAGTVRLDRSLLTANTATLTHGGAVDNYTTTASLTTTNSTFYQNAAASQGGAIRNIGTITLVNDTFDDNTAARGKTIFNLGTANVLNTILGTDPGPASSLEGVFNSVGSNIVVDATLATGFVNGQNGDQVGDASNPIDPQLGQLADNGGETDTMALLAGSPAIDRGNNCVTTAACGTSPQIRIRTDQRGRFRNFFTGVVDIGAFEVVNQTSSGTVGIGFGSVRGPNRFHGMSAILTNAVTNEKRYFPVSMAGEVTLRNLPDSVYVLEVKSKRAGYGFGPFVIGGSDTPLLGLGEPGSELIRAETRP
jgi:CSLREA domain-containing protein